MRLTLVIFSLQQVGGAERVISIISNYWAAQNYKITILTFDRGTKPSFYDLDPRIAHLPLGIARHSSNFSAAIWNNLKRVQKLRTAIENTKPDIVISFIDVTNVTTLLATRGLAAPVIVSERIDPTMYSIGIWWQKLRNLTYQFADRIVVQTNSALNYFIGQLSTPVAVIPNPVLPIADCGYRLEKLWGQRTIMAMGRLTRQKGFDLLIEAFDRLKNLHPNWKLVIFGEGELRSELENYIRHLRLTDRVYLPGVVQSPSNALKQADIFVMPSRFEGFPNALCEAMACGLPVIATDCPSGPRDIIRDGWDGILVANENIDALSSAMSQLMTSEQKRQYLASHAPEILNRFGLETVMGMWERLLNEVANDYR